MGMKKAPEGRCETCRVQHCRLCQVLAAIESVHAGRVSVPRRYSKGRLLLDGNRFPETFGIVVAGVIKLMHVDEEGDQEIVDFLFPGDYIGLPEPLTTPIIGEAATDVEICCFPLRIFDSLVTQHAALRAVILTHTQLQLNGSRMWTRVLAQRPAQERIASFLIMLVQRTRRAPGGPGRLALDLPMSRTQLAGYLGLALETISRQFAQLRDAGIIETRGRTHLRVIDWQRLKSLANPLASAHESVSR